MIERERKMSATVNLTTKTPFLSRQKIAFLNKQYDWWQFIIWNLWKVKIQSTMGFESLVLEWIKPP